MFRPPLHRTSRTRPEAHSSPATSSKKAVSPIAFSAPCHRRKGPRPFEDPTEQAYHLPERGGPWPRKKRNAPTRGATAWWIRTRSIAATTATIRPARWKSRVTAITPNAKLRLLRPEHEGRPVYSLRPEPRRRRTAPALHQRRNAGGRWFDNGERC